MEQQKQDEKCKPPKQQRWRFFGTRRKVPRTQSAPAKPQSSTILVGSGEVVPGGTNNSASRNKSFAIVGVVDHSESPTSFISEEVYTEEQQQYQHEQQRQVLASSVSLSRVGASIGEPSPVREILAYCPGVMQDEEIGILAMFQEIQLQLLPPSSSSSYFDHLHEYSDENVVKQAMLKLFALAASSELGRVVTDDQYGFSAMFREWGHQLGLRKYKMNAVQLMDALVAYVLRASYAVVKSGHDIGNAITLADEDFVSIINNDDDDISLTGMFKEVSNHFPGILSEREAETYVLTRFMQVAEEATVRKGEVEFARCSSLDDNNKGYSSLSRQK